MAADDMVPGIMVSRGAILFIYCLFIVYLLCIIYLFIVGCHVIDSLK